MLRLVLCALCLTPLTAGAADLPAYTVLVSGVKLQPLLTNYWGSGDLHSRHQGVQFRSRGAPVLFLSNPPGVDSGVRRSQLDLINWMNNRHFDRIGDPEIKTRIEAFELGYSMQSSVPGLMDISKEPKKVHELYGTCLLYTSPSPRDATLSRMPSSA
mgnify:CR=1 FL=1